MQFLNLKINTLLNLETLSFKEHRNRNLIKDSLFSRRSFKVYLGEKSKFLSKIIKGEPGAWISPIFSIKSKIKLFNWKKRYKILNKDFEDQQQDKSSYKIKFLN